MAMIGDWREDTMKSSSWFSLGMLIFFSGKLSHFLEIQCFPRLNVHVWWVFHIYLPSIKQT